MAEVIVLRDEEIEGLVTFEETMEMVEKAFADFYQGHSSVFPVVREEIEKHQGIFGVKSGYLAKDEVLGFKAGGFWLNNGQKGLTNHQSTMVLFDPLTGRPKALLGANYITKIRTAALGAIGCKYLARQDSKIITVIGAGLQGRNQLLASLNVLPSIEEIRVYDLNIEYAKMMVKEMNEEIEPSIQAFGDAEEACRGTDVILTTTPSYKFIVKNEWINKGTHLNCIGSDTKGKQEIDPQIFTRAKIVVDNLEQCITIGETQHAYNLGVIDKEDIYAEIGSVVSTGSPVRTNSSEITIFDTTGVTIQDLIVAGKVIEKAESLSKGTKVIV